MIVVGIDPGITGAVAVMDGANVVRVYDTPIALVNNKKVYDPLRMLEILQLAGKATVYIELVHGGIFANRLGPGGKPMTMGAVSAFNFGKGYGLWLGLIAALSLPHVQVAPATWKKHLLADMPKGKGASLEVAKRLYPEKALTVLTRQKDEGRAEAMLIATYGYRRQSGLLGHTTRAPRAEGETDGERSGEARAASR